MDGRSLPGRQASGAVGVPSWGELVMPSVARTVMFRFMRWRRQHHLIARDPLALDARVDPHARELKFTHVYTADNGETARWLTSPAYADEAAKQDPIDLCHLAVDRFHTSLETGDVAARDEFLTIARGLLEAGRTVTLDGRRCFVMPHFDQVEGYAPHATPWVNAMVQGWIGAVFMRAHQVIGDRRYRDAAVQAVGPCFVPVARGGLRDTERNGRVFYEKYAFPGQTRHVLNGFMASLLGLWDVARASDDADAHRAFEEGVASLDDTVLATYDNGHTSLYDQQPDRRATPACVFYTWIHARQLASLARITRQQRLAEWAARWRTYTRDVGHRATTTLEVLGYRARNLPRYLALERFAKAPWWP
ncbi:MAG TPA: D-glucuronyl C5-epimerase family protein [Kofleriaceae bacterium]|nr:D-glucuronyl C5-epimerase family protein [Kofleriaceae bacterium]